MKPISFRSKPAIVLGLLALMGVSAGAWALFFRTLDGAETSYRLASVERGAIVSTVTTSGTLNAVITVLVSSQVSGQIKELLADFNSEVKADQVIARIDPETFEARVLQAEADLEVAKANVGIQLSGVDRSRRELENAQAAYAAATAQNEKAGITLANSRRNRDRRKTLFQSGAVSESQTDDAQTVHDQALAQLKSAEAEEKAAASLIASREAAVGTAKAQVNHAREQVRQREAALHQARVDREHTFIRSPMDGVVIERAVDVGQTVAASLQAPKLFTIARDLREMQVETDVDEADIGRVQVGQPATFTVDAYPGREFNGRVLQIRKAPRVVQNVVTYTVLVSSFNGDHRLLPGMTANIQIVVSERRDILKIPNSALRFRPNGEDARVQGPLAEPQNTALPAGETGQPEERLKQLAAALGLNESQQNQARVIIIEVRDKLGAMRRQGAGLDEIRKEAQVLREKSRMAIAALLSPEQREKYTAMAGAREAGPAARVRVYVFTEKARPAPIDFVPGISDGAFTEVLSGDLKVGQQVVIGMNAPLPKPAARPAARIGF